MQPVQEVQYSVDILNLTKIFNRNDHRNEGGFSSYSTLKSLLLASIKRLLFSSKEVENSVNLTTTNPKKLSGIAIKDLTIRVPSGASVGIIGPNGAGKSTLLKLLSGIYHPTSGQIKINGRVAALIELGAGFHPDFTGRENVFLAGIMYGLTKHQIEERFDQIVAFAELTAVIDEPVRTYSSGMFMRLGFSLAVHTEPEILIIDEVLAVGDAAFVIKCESRLAELKRQGKTLLLVSHDLEAVVRWCDEVIWLSNGEVHDRGEPKRVVDAYRLSVEKKEEQGLLKQNQAQLAFNNSSSSNSSPKDSVSGESSLDQDLQYQRWGSREVEIVNVTVVNSKGEESALFNPEDQLIIRINLKKRGQLVAKGHDSLVCGIALHRTDGVLVLGTNSDIEGHNLETNFSDLVVELKINRIGLTSGSYTLDVAAHSKDGYPFDYHRHLYKFSVRGGKSRVGVAALPLNFSSKISS